MASLIRATSLYGIDCLIEDLGGDCNALLACCHIDIDFNQLPTQYIQYRQYANLLETCSETLNCPDFGIQLANRQNFEILGHIAMVAKTGTTLSEVLTWVIKYLHIHSPAISLKTNNVNNGKSVMLSFDILLKPLPKISQVTELTLALTVNTIRELSNQRCHPNIVYLLQKNEKNNYAYRQQFGCEVVGFRHISGIELAVNDLAMTVDNIESSIAQSSLAFVTSQGEVVMTMADRVESLIKPLLAIGQCNNEQIATSLGVSVRQLHRKLVLQGTSFVKLKDRVRQSLALHYLQQSTLPIGYISELLGYQEQATFSVACKRWFDVSPRCVRKQY